MNLLRSSAFAAILVAVTFSARCVRSSANEIDPSAQIASRQIADWIGELDAARFSDRQRASKALRRLGAKAIPALTDAALGKSREASTRATMILQAMMEAGANTESDSAAREQAELSLERIANSGKPAAAIAKRALQPAPGKAAIRTFDVSPGEPIGNAKDLSATEKSLTAPQSRVD